MTNTNGKQFHLLQIFRVYKNFKSITITNCDLPKDENFRLRLIKTICTYQKNSLEVLNLQFLKLGVAESLAIFELLKNNTKLKYLNLYGNKFGVEGAKNIAAGLALNCTLEYLNLGLNRIRNKGAA